MRSALAPQFHNFDSEGPLVVSARARLFSAFRTFLDIRHRTNGDEVILSSMRDEFRPLAKNDIPLIVLTHNEKRLIPPFLAHYRALGVTRFLVVDDASTDGSAELLAAQPDVDLYTSNVRYKCANRGRRWRQMLVERYGRDRWYVSVDADEFLVAPGLETVGLAGFIAALERRKIWHMPAIMLDMYPAGRVSGATYDGACGQMPWTVARLFDASGYSIRTCKRSWEITGGVRKRAFGDPYILNKYPLLFWDAYTNLNRSIHSPAPYWRNYAPIFGALLHFKFFSDYAARFRTAIADAQYASRGYYYANILAQLYDPDSLILESEVSTPYRDAADLVRRGFLTELPLAR